MTVEVVAKHKVGEAISCIVCGEPSVASDFLSMYCQAHTDMLDAAAKKEIPDMTDDELDILRNWNVSVGVSIHATDDTVKMITSLFTNIVSLSEEVGARRERRGK